MLHLAKEIHATAREKGWWDNPREFATTVMLIVTELDELDDAYRHTNPDHLEFVMSPANDQMFPLAYRQEIKDTRQAEMAGTCIRLLDMAYSDPELFARFEVYVGQARQMIEASGYGRRDMNRAAWEGTKMLCKAVEADRVGHKEIAALHLGMFMAHMEAWAKKESIDLELFMRAEMRYNATRERLHGKAY
jgi:hypothetical protein